MGGESALDGLCSSSSESRQRALSHRQRVSTSHTTEICRKYDRETKCHPIRIFFSRRFRFSHHSKSKGALSNTRGTTSPFRIFASRYRNCVPLGGESALDGRCSSCSERQTKGSHTPTESEYVSHDKDYQDI